MNPTLSFVLTADIGGSHITSAVCNAQSKSVIKSSVVRQEVDSKSTASDIFDCWIKALNRSAKRLNAGISELALAMPGPFDYQNGISYIKGLDKYEALYGLDVRQRLADRLNLKVADIRFINDAEATIAGESVAGAGVGFKSVLGITLGTGFGSAFCMDNNTRDINAGSEIFGDSIVDDYLSTRWFIKRYYDLTGERVKGVKELAASYHSDTAIPKVFHEFANNLDTVLSAMIAQYKPEVVVICGSINKAYELFLPELYQSSNMAKIVLGSLGEHATLIGASALFDFVKEGKLKY